MAGLTEPNVIDLVAQDADGTGILVMVESRPWGTDPSQPSQLRAKFNTYAQFVLDGGLISSYPELEGLPLHIRLDCPTAPTAEIASIVDTATTQLDAYGLRVSVRVDPNIAGPK